MRVFYPPSLSPEGFCPAGGTPFGHPSDENGGASPSLRKDQPGPLVENGGPSSRPAFPQGVSRTYPRGDAFTPVPVPEGFCHQGGTNRGDENGRVPPYVKPGPLVENGGRALPPNPAPVLPGQARYPRGVCANSSTPRRQHKRGWVSSLHPRRTQAPCPRPHLPYQGSG